MIYTGQKIAITEHAYMFRKLKLVKRLQHKNLVLYYY